MIIYIPFSHDHDRYEHDSMGHVITVDHLSLRLSFLRLQLYLRSLAIPLHHIPAADISLK